MAQQGNTVQPTIPFKRDSNGAAALASSGSGVMLVSLLVIATVQVIRKRLRVDAPAGGNGVVHVLDTGCIGTRVLVSVIGFEGSQHLLVQSEQGVSSIASACRRPGITTAASMPKPVPALAIGALVALPAGPSALAAGPATSLLGMQIRMGGARCDMSAAVEILLGLTVPSLAPGILMSTTVFVRIMIFLRFLLVDPVVSSALVVLGMIMVPPVSILLPLKTLVAILVGRALLGTFS